MRGIVPDHLQRIIILAFNDTNGGIFSDGERQVTDLAVQLHSDRRLGQRLGNRIRHIESAGARRKRPHASIWKSKRDGIMTGRGA